MKSKKARFLIRKGEFTYIGYAGCKYTDNRAISKNAALDAVKIAEQEAEERMRVLKPNGTLIFKWNEQQIPTSRIIEVIGQKPLFGHTSGKGGKTIWMCFLKK